MEAIGYKTKSVAAGSRVLIGWHSSCSFALHAAAMLSIFMCTALHLHGTGGTHQSPPPIRRLRSQCQHYFSGRPRRCIYVAAGMRCRLSLTSAATVARFRASSPLQLQAPPAQSKLKGADELCQDATGHRQAPAPAFTTWLLQLPGSHSGHWQQCTHRQRARHKYRPWSLCANTSCTATPSPQPPVKTRGAAGCGWRWRGPGPEWRGEGGQQQQGGEG